MADTIIVKTVQWPPKDPEESRSYGHEYEEAAEDPITNSVWVVTGVIKVSELIEAPNIVHIKLSGGVADEVAEIKNVVTTATGEIIVRRVNLQIKLR